MLGLHRKSSIHISGVLLTCGVTGHVKWYGANLSGLSVTGVFEFDGSDFLVLGLKRKSSVNISELLVGVGFFCLVGADSILRLVLWCWVHMSGRKCHGCD